MFSSCRATRLGEFSAYLVIVYFGQFFENLRPSINLWVDARKVRNGQAGTDVMIFVNIFAKKFGEKIGVFYSKQS
jgi:hypothetical protein